MSERTNRTTYIAAAGVDNVVSDSQAILESIIVGKAVTGGVIDVSDHASSGSSNVKIQLTDPAVRVYEVEARFENGITVDLTTQTNVSVVWRPA